MGRTSTTPFTGELMVPYPKRVRASSSRGLGLFKLAPGLGDILRPVAFLHQAVLRRGALVSLFGHEVVGLELVPGDAGYDLSLIEVFVALIIQLFIYQVRLGLAHLGLGFLDLLGPVTVLVLVQVGLGRGQGGPGPVHLVFEVLGLQAGHGLVRGDPVALLEKDVLDNAGNLEGQIGLGGLHVPFQAQGIIGLPGFPPYQPVSQPPDHQHCDQDDRDKSPG